MMKSIDASDSRFAEFMDLAFKFKDIALQKVEARIEKIEYQINIAKMKNFNENKKLDEMVSRAHNMLKEVPGDKAVAAEFDQLELLKEIAC